MTKVITRYFDDADAALKARKELLYIKRLSQRIVQLFDADSGTADSLEAAGVAPATAKAYADRLSRGGAVLLVRAGFKPLSVAQTSRDVMAQMGAVDLGDLVEEVEYKDKVHRGLNILRDHPLMMSRPRDPEATNFYMADWPIPLINRKKPFTMAVFPPHARMANWPIPLISRRKPKDNFAFPRHARMANFPIPLISKRTPKDKFAFPRHARMADFPIPLISRRKPYSGTMIGRHTRMANWPFPHLINGKTGTNALMPGGPRMANFPIPLLSDRKPYTGSAFSRHARMANFPIPLISKRTPSDKFAFPRHARMANFILPLVIKERDKARSGKATGFSFSEMLGIPTVTRR